MSEFYFIAFSVFAAVVCNSDKSYHSCQNGVYETLYQVTEECRRVSNTPYLRDLRKSLKRLSAKHVVDKLQEYCTTVNDTNNCVEGYINFLPCLKEELEEFRVMSRRSNWYCNGSNVKDVIKDIYIGLPTQTLNYRDNVCYKEAPVNAYPCIRKYLNVSKPPKNKRETMKQILSSFQCTYRKLLPKCGRKASLMLTTLEYDWLIIPPALGINVSDKLIAVAKLKVKDS